MNKTLIFCAALALGTVACGGEEEASTVTALGTAVAQPGSPAPAAAAPSGGGSTNFGTVALAAGFSAPHVVEGRSGGSTDASTVSPDCVGNIDSTPDHALDLSAAMAGLRIFAAAEQDITLVIQQPDGSYVCNDDFDGTNPLVTAESFAPGTYKIWIGNYDASEGAAAYRLGFSTAADASPAQLAQ